MRGLFPDPVRRAPPRRRVAGPCPGCGGRDFLPPRGPWAVLGVCGECVGCRDEFGRREVVAEILVTDRPPDPDFCPHPPGSDAKVDWMAGRAARGLSIFRVLDDDGPAPYKVPTGAPEYQHDPGETGVERCGDKWRCRPYWRGKKWHLGLYDTEADALARSRDFWRDHAKDDRPAPVLWLPCAPEDCDGALPVEREHLAAWRGQFCGLKERVSLKVVRKYRVQLKRMRPRARPAAGAVWAELMARLDAAAGPTLFGTLAADESTEFSMGV